MSTDPLLLPPHPPTDRGEAGGISMKKKRRAKDIWHFLGSGGVDGVGDPQPTPSSDACTQPLSSDPVRAALLAGWRLRVTYAINAP